jgi:ataxia telangiectasia mutated family protein
MQLYSFRPMDLHPQKFRDEMKEIQSRDHTAHAQLIHKFLQNQKSFKPVMRHFFTEMRNDPVGWHTMRLKYARSVAVGSMVGHLVGLGDRHCSNIMINTKTGEILHIDLGIAFDQVRLGKAVNSSELKLCIAQGGDLNIPERVPFRLTADMIDGLGSFGVEGVFKRCCEQTLRLLREKADLILAVLEVFRHDPLQKWYVMNASWLISCTDICMITGKRTLTKSTKCKVGWPPRRTGRRWRRMLPTLQRPPWTGFEPSF